ncbi:MAG: hypothetical protein CRU78_11780 [Candidatus Accumulibacter phosphatis]|uniref:Uncharacterized protein n=1 Tax=Candidatus Accumulibacter phosphatis TaxID=327160 RepID=A0A6A7RU95_9PROT|nr:hypothetical protein [Candidatus Accumulibacter phosphatis]
MDFTTEPAAFDPSPELLAWMEKRVGGLVEEARTRATEIHWRDVKIEKLTLELASGAVLGQSGPSGVCTNAHGC